MRTAIASLALVVAACSGTEPQDDIAADAADTAVADVAQPVISPCGAQKTYDTIREIVFDKAVRMAPGDPVPLNDLRRSIGINMKSPVVSAVHDELGRTECTGRFVIGIPPMAQEAFGGAVELEADLTYSIQPAADGSGDVVQVQGTDYLVQRIVAAETERSSRRLAAAGGPQLQRTYNPSFDCGAGLNNVERMICQDEGVSHRDRELSNGFKARLASNSGEARNKLLEYQRNALSKRNQCPDTDCLYRWYDAELQYYHRTH